MKKYVILLVIFFSAIIFVHGEEVVEQFIYGNITLEIIKSQKGKYKFCVKNSNNQFLKESEWNVSYPPPEIYWLGGSYFELKGGSTFAPDFYCIIYDSSRNMMSQPFYFPIAIDITNQIILTVSDDNKLYLQKIFEPDKKKFIAFPPDFYETASLLGSLGTDSRFEEGNLFLSYITSYSANCTCIKKIIKIPIIMD